MGPLKNMPPTVLGLYGGVILGAVVMMVAGGLGFKALADMSLILGICAGPSIGWIVGKVRAKRYEQEHPEEKGAEEKEPTEK
ncbi:MAG: hypothetical protein Q4C53_06590 [Clostridia bacterium]|nr:hypothetical protein [Clostridia bacterium]